MNWVGGSRKRIIFTKERRKQKDFFEKERLKSKMKVLGTLPHKHSANSLDLLNLHVVNQISTKRNHPGKVQKPVHVDINQVPGRWCSIELPKTPEHKPPKPFLEDSQNRLQKEVLENRRKYLSEKENLWFESGNIVHETSWLATAASKQRNFSDSEAEKPLALYFQQLSSPGCSQSFGKSPKVSGGKDFKNREEPLFGVTCGRERSNATQDAQPIAALFEEDHQFPAVPSSEFYHSFSNKNIISQPLTDSSYVNQTSRTYGPYDVKEKPQTASCAKRCLAERDLESIFTAPEQIYLQNTQSFSILDEEPVKNHLKEYCIQDRNFLTSEEQEDTTDSESAGRYISQHKNIKTAATMCKYIKKNPKGILAEPNLNRLHIFGLGQTGEEVCNKHSQSSKPTRENDDASQLSSQSPSYSPEPTENCASMASDESTEDDQDGDMSSCYENYSPRNNGNPLAALGNQKSRCSFPSMDTPFLLCNSVTRDKATIDQRKDDIVLPLQITSHRSFKNKHVNWHNTCPQTAYARRNTCPQMEKCSWEIEKSDAAVQCDLLQVCSCKKAVSSVHSAEIVTSISKIETTRGQNILADRAAFHPSSTSGAVVVKDLPSEREYLETIAK